MVQTIWPSESHSALFDNGKELLSPFAVKINECCSTKHPHYPSFVIYHIIPQSPQIEFTDGMKTLSRQI